MGRAGADTVGTPLTLPWSLALCPRVSNINIPGSAASGSWFQDYITSPSSLLHFHTLLWLLPIILCHCCGHLSYHCLSFCFTVTVPFPQAWAALSSEAACLVLMYSAGVCPAGPLSVFSAWVWLPLFWGSPGWALLEPWAHDGFSLRLLHLSVQWVLDFQNEIWTFLFWCIFIYAKVFLFIGFNLKIQLIEPHKIPASDLGGSPYPPAFPGTCLCSVNIEYRVYFYSHFMGHRLDWVFFFIDDY